MKDIRLFAFAVIAFVIAARFAAGAADSPPAGATTEDADKDNNGPCQAIRVFASDRLGTPLTPTPLTPLKGEHFINLQPQVHFPCVLPPHLPLNFVIASVPDPIGTHLQLWFDRSVESILSAAGYVGFRFQRSWIPWDADLVREEPDVEKREAQQDLLRLREAEPGVLLFRAPACPGHDHYLTHLECRDLVVLLVPETPTEGLVQGVFLAATKIVLSASSPLSSNPNPKIPVLGPAFSGSFSSLAKIMDRVDGEKPAPKLRVISGTAASSKGPEVLPKGADYHRTVHTVDDQLQMLEDHIRKKSDKHLPRMALLTESDTGSGWQFADGTQPGYNSGESDRFVYRYPREISRLRNAYGDQVLKAVVGAQPQTPSFQKILGFRLFDVGPSMDSTPVMATTQTPLSQDAILEDIARSMQRDRITLAGIVATDIFDALFIVRYLRDACPDIRLFTFDSDLLYEKGAEDFPFDGTLALSTYPLMLSNQIWTGLQRKDSNANIFEDRILFPSRGAEGTYNAMRALLVQSGYVSEPMAQEPLAEYFDPSLTCSSSATASPGCNTPPIWLTVVTRTGYWPIAVESQDKFRRGPETNAPVEEHDADMVEGVAAGHSPRFSIDAPPRLWRLFFLLTVLSLSWYFLNHFAACASDRGDLQRVAHLKARPGAERRLARLYSRFAGLGERQGLAQLNLWPNEEGWLARLCYLLVCSFSLIAFYGIYVLPLMTISSYRDESRLHLAQYTAGIFFVAFLALAFSPCLRFRKRRDKVGISRTIWPETWHYGILSSSALLIAVIIFNAARLFPFRHDPGSDQWAFFMAYRSLHLESGVSPLLPVLALLAAYFGWGRVHLKRIILRFERLGSLPVLGSGPGFEALANCHASLEKFVDEPLLLHWRTIGSFVVVVFIFHYLPLPLKSFEPKEFDQLVLLLLAILYALLFLTWTRFILIWTKFRLVLERLEQHPIRFSFSELPGPTSISPLLQVTRRRRYSALVAVRGRLRALAKNASEEWTAAVSTYERQVDALLESATHGIEVRRANALPLLQSLKWINDIIVGELNQGSWREGRYERKEGAKDADAAASVPRPEVLRQEIIAIQYRDYIQYIVHQQQNLLAFVTAGFLLSMLALHCYPFQSPRIITTFISAGFLIFGAGVLTVLAQADRDPVLSRITKTTPEKLSSGFFLRAAGYLGLPLITVLASQFPSWGRFLFSWIQPMLEALK